MLVVDFSLSVCRDAIPQYPVEVLAYAVMHDLMDLAERALPAASAVSYVSAHSILDKKPLVFSVWVGALALPPFIRYLTNPTY